MSIPVKRALLSVSDKTGLADFGKFLASKNVHILSTGGTAKALRDAGLEVQDVSDYTGFPEIMDGRVKTLHPKIHGGLLGKRGHPDHEDAMSRLDIGKIDMVVVNLYPFEATVAKGADFPTCIENIDIGGPSMVRSAAKNHESVAIVTEAAQYEAVMNDMNNNGGSLTAELRRSLAAQAFSLTAAYDSAISKWFVEQTTQAGTTAFPNKLTASGTLKQTLRYGENPHQSAAVYSTGDKRPGVVTAEQLQGKELSYNNLNDTDAAFELVCEFEEPAVAIIKHANPCGVAVGSSIEEAYDKALTSDPVSAFGGIVACNRNITAAAAEKMAKLFLEVIIAPGADDAAREFFAKKKNLRVLITGAMPDPVADGMNFKSISGGFLFQSRDSGRVKREDLKIVTKKQPTKEQMDDLIFAFKVCKHVKSNAIVYVSDGKTVGVGAGQMSRVDSARIAGQKCKETSEAAGLSESKAVGSVVASDAFFPFPDGLLATAANGATCVIQPGGSMRDNEVIEAADNAGLAMVFTGMRHFRH